MKAKLGGKSPTEWHQKFITLIADYKLTNKNTSRFESINQMHRRNSSNIRFDEWQTDHPRADAWPFLSRAAMNLLRLEHATRHPDTYQKKDYIDPAIKTLKQFKRDFSFINKHFHFQKEFEGKIEKLSEQIAKAGNAHLADIDELKPQADEWKKNIVKFGITQRYSFLIADLNNHEERLGLPLTPNGQIDYMIRVLENRKKENPKFWRKKMIYSLACLYGLLDFGIDRNDLANAASGVIAEAGAKEVSASTIISDYSRMPKWGESVDLALTRKQICY